MFLIFSLYMMGLDPLHFFLYYAFEIINVTFDNVCIIFILFIILKAYEMELKRNGEDPFPPLKTWSKSSFRLIAYSLACPSLPSCWHALQESLATSSLHNAAVQQQYWSVLYVDMSLWCKYHFFSEKDSICFQGLICECQRFYTKNQLETSFGVDL